MSAQFAARAESAFDTALNRLAEPPLRANPQFHAVDSPGRRSAFRLEGTDKPPFLFEFGTEFEVWLGPLSEVFVSTEQDEGELIDDIVRILTSRVSIECTRRRIVVTFIDVFNVAWLRSNHVAIGGRYRLESNLRSDYPPAF